MQARQVPNEPHPQPQDASLGEEETVNTVTAPFHPQDDSNFSSTEMIKRSSQI